MGFRTSHAMIIPYSAKGHVTPCLQLSKLLHPAASTSPSSTPTTTAAACCSPVGLSLSLSLFGIDRFRFKSIPNGLLASEDDDRTQDIPELCVSTRKSCGGPLRELIARIGSSAGKPSVSYVIADSFMTFVLDVVEEVGVLGLVFCTMSTCGFRGYLHFFDLIDGGYVPLKGQGERRKKMEKKSTHFTLACSPLSKMVKEKGSLADLGLHQGTHRSSTTMNLLHGLDASTDKEAETYNIENITDRDATKCMELFPVGNTGEQEKSQLTIFYDVNMFVFDNYFDVHNTDYYEKIKIFTKTVLR